MSWAELGNLEAGEKWKMQKVGQKGKRIFTKHAATIWVATSTTKIVIQTLLYLSTVEVIHKMNLTRVISSI